MFKELLEPPDKGSEGEGLNESAPNREAFRPIHYLGSKLRIVGEVVQAVDYIDPHNAPACDLFAGSGTIAHALAKTRPVIAADIQAYSTAICRSLLGTDSNDHGTYNAKSASNLYDESLLNALEEAADICPMQAIEIEG